MKEEEGRKGSGQNFIFLFGSSLSPLMSIFSSYLGLSGPAHTHGRKTPPEHNLLEAGRAKTTCSFRRASVCLRFG